VRHVVGCAESGVGFEERADGEKEVVVVMTQIY
jgi:hypothetical protein